VSEDLTSKSISELAAKIRSRTITATELVEAHLKRIEQVNPRLNAIVTIAPDVLEQAQAADKSLSEDGCPGPLHGVPLTIKDTIATKGLRTTYGSRIRDRHYPENDAHVVQRLRAAGAIILGKTNTPEMAIPYESDNPVFGRTNNPHDLNRTSGGSSGGEAAAIAAHLSPGGVGSDLSGSIRVPAHFCGIAGLKPTTGLIPMDGHVPEATGTLALGACIGPMARRVGDLTLLLRIMSGALPGTGAANQTNVELRGVKAAYYYDDGVSPVTSETLLAVEKAANVLSEAGLQVRLERPPPVSHGSRLWVELFSQVAGDQIREFYRGREDQAGPLVASLLSHQLDKSTLEDRIEIAERTARAVVERERLRESLLRWMKTTPLIIAPVGAVPAFVHGAYQVIVDGELVRTFRAFSYSQTFNVFGLPALSVPVARSADGLPIGVQIIGRPFEESRVLAAGAIIEGSL